MNHYYFMILYFSKKAFYFYYNIDKYHYTTLFDEQTWVYSNHTVFLRQITVFVVGVGSKDE